MRSKNVQVPGTEWNGGHQGLGRRRRGAGGQGTGDVREKTRPGGRHSDHGERRRLRPEAFAPPTRVTEVMEARTSALRSLHTRCAHRGDRLHACVDTSLTASCTPMTPGYKWTKDMSRCTENDRNGS